ncbi:alpha/beta hydrolase [Mucilaginibacter sp. JRF]|uniref:alpha/beta fold hydrolase n=1 Tax=Mucilaginibacter sp. JRF TaxID=2780088 RepID=UPI00187DEDC7|nr:alpha/beta hydrolase [Mucilaginibacter sp. JRF]MBE9584309.1 alpha/beta hydrolase [Mucilaginibacter sp. JRF]
MPPLRFLLLTILLFASGSVYSQIAEMDTTIYGRNTATGKYASIRGFKMYYETYGKGEPLLLIHGNGASISSFVLQIPYFAKNYQVIVADSRAQGKSVDTSDSLSYEMMADDLNALLDTLHLKSVNVFGWSDGGINALLLSLRHPDKVKKLALTGANLRPDTTAVDPQVYSMAMGWNRQIQDSLKLMKPPSAQLKNTAKVMHLLSYQPNIPASALHKINCPVLVIAGDHDVIKNSHTLEIAENIPNSYLWIIPNAGHATPIYKKDWFNNTLSDFFKKPYRKIEGEARFN